MDFNFLKDDCGLGLDLLLLLDIKLSFFICTSPYSGQRGISPAYVGKNTPISLDLIRWLLKLEQLKRVDEDHFVDILLLLLLFLLILLFLKFSHLMDKFKKG